ncbi:DUF6214 family protein [Streptomyces sp. NPDC060223]|uniref:DUF6214 family protein n=1 Tax=Streptomyces sp. NPDC060223 TaxID=3347077 RepID=UPI003669F293
MSVSPAWKVRECEGVTSWFDVRLAFADGARVDLLAVVCEGTVSIEDVRAQPPLSLGDLDLLADWIEEPLAEACGARTAPTCEGLCGEGLPHEGPCGERLSGDGTCGDKLSYDASYEEGSSRRARPAWPRGVEGRPLVAEEYLAAQGEGRDPVLAVMDVTGHSRRRSLKLIAGARDAGFLTPRHVRR